MAERNSTSPKPHAWQPIETAPKDPWELHKRAAVGGWKHKTYGWLWGRLNWHNAKHLTAGGYWLTDNGGTPTHWMQLDPPVEEPSNQE